MNKWNKFITFILILKKKLQTYFKNQKNINYFSAFWNFRSIRKSLDYEKQRKSLKCNSYKQKSSVVKMNIENNYLI